MANKMKFRKTSIDILKLISLIFILSNFELSQFKVNHFINPANAFSQSDVDKLFARGKQLYKSDRYEEAIKIWLQALKIYKNSNPLKESEILSNIILAYIGLENAPEALSFAQRAVQKSKGTHPDAQSFALYVLELSYGIYERHPDAVDSYEKALAITQITNDPNTRANTLIGLGDAYGSWGKYDQAIKAYENANKLAIENNYPRIKQHVKEHLNYLYMMISNPGYRDSQFDQSFKQCDILVAVN
jgi:tetratricopeptide (TPR) repeat protein